MQNPVQHSRTPVQASPGSKSSRQADEGSEVMQLASSPELSEGALLPAAGLPGPFAFLAGTGPSSMDVKMRRHKRGREQWRGVLTHREKISEGKWPNKCLMSDRIFL